MKKNTLKTKFRQFTARRVPETENMHKGAMGGSIAGMVTGIVLMPIDGGITAFVSMGTFASTLISANIHASSGAFNIKDGYNGDFEFNGERYNVSKNQYVKLMQLEKKIDGLKQKFEEAKTDQKALKIRTKIQKLTDHQKDILMSDNVVSKKDVENRKVKTLDINYDIGRKSQPRSN